MDEHEMTDEQLAIVTVTTSAWFATIDWAGRHYGNLTFKQRALAKAVASGLLAAGLYKVAKPMATGVLASGLASATTDLATAYNVAHYGGPPQAPHAAPPAINPAGLALPRGDVAYGQPLTAADGYFVRVK